MKRHCWILHLHRDGECVAVAVGGTPGHAAVPVVEHQQRRGVRGVAQLLLARLHAREVAEEVGGVVADGGQLVAEQLHPEVQPAVGVPLATPVSDV